MRSIPRPWRTLRGRLVLAAAAGLVTAAVVFAAVGAGLIRAQSQVVARAELDRQAEQLAKLISTQAERALTRGTQVPSFEPTSIEALVGENTKLYYTGLALTPGSEQPTSEIPAVVAGQIDYEVLERTGVQRIDFTQPGQSVVSEASAAPVTIGGEQFGAILLARPPGELASAWPDVAGRVVGAAGIGLGVALLLTLLLTSRITRPLTAMQAATHRVARGDMRTELGSTGTQELDELASDFNHMVQADRRARRGEPRVPDARHPRPAHAPHGHPRPRRRVVRRHRAPRRRAAIAGGDRGRGRPPGDPGGRPARPGAPRRASLQARPHPRGAHRGARHGLRRHGGRGRRARGRLRAAHRGARPGRDRRDPRAPDHDQPARQRHPLDASRAARCAWRGAHSPAAGSWRR